MRRGEQEEPDRNYSHPCTYVEDFCLQTVQTTNLFWQLLPKAKGEDLPFGKESIFSFQKNHPLLEDTKFKLSLGMSLVFGASRNISFNGGNHVLKFFTESFENVPSSFF